MTTHSLEGMDRVKALADHLRSMAPVARSAEQRGTSVNAEAWQIATALADIEESANKLFAVLVPKLLQTDSFSFEANALLTDVGEEYRHMLYHIQDTKLFGYIVPHE